MKLLHIFLIIQTEPSDYATKLANNMQLYPPEHYVSVSSAALTV